MIQTTTKITAATDTMKRAPFLKLNFSSQNQLSHVRLIMFRRSVLLTALLVVALFEWQMNHLSISEILNVSNIHYHKSDRFPTQLFTASMPSLRGSHLDFGRSVPSIIKKITRPLLSTKTNTNTHTAKPSQQPLIEIYEFTSKRFKVYKSINEMNHEYFADLLKKKVSQFVVANRMLKGRNQMSKYFVYTIKQRVRMALKPMVESSFYILINKYDLIKFLGDLGYVLQNGLVANDMIFRRLDKT